MEARPQLAQPSQSAGSADGRARFDRRNGLQRFLLSIRLIEGGSLSTHDERPAVHMLGLSLTLAVVGTYAFTLIRYLFALHNGFSTSAEDLGIMDQTLWNTVHGHFMRQTICNPVSDYNCLGIVSRFAIHFEPILAILAPIYLVLPNVKTLMALQVITVASGAIPVYLLAVRRLGRATWGVAFALLYLLHPSLQSATLAAFHPEVLAAPILVWAFYCLATRHYRTLVALCVVALLCKETLALDVCMLGFYVVLIQQRRKLGLLLILVSMGTLALALMLMHITSPLGYSPVASRLTGLYRQPLQTIAIRIFDPQRLAYPGRLLAPVGFLPLLSPWMLMIAVPSFLVNLASSDPLMSTGGYQYNADIVPVLIVASIDGLVWTLPALRHLARRVAPQLSRASYSLIGLLLSPRMRVRLRSAAPVGFVALALVSSLPILGAQPDVSEAWTASFKPYSAWPAMTSHDVLGTQLLRLIPANASVSAQSMLAPHLSERYRVYQFPSGESDAEYIVLDVSRGSFYPYSTSADYIDAIAQLLRSCSMEVVAAQDGYLLLHHIDTQQPVGAICRHPLPQAFYSFAYASSSPKMHEASATFGGSLQLVGYTINTTRVHLGQTPLVVTTYWKAKASLPLPMVIVVTISRNGQTLLSVTDSWTQYWLPPLQWEPGQTMRVQTWPIYLGNQERGSLVIGVQVCYDIPDEEATSLVAADASIDSASPATSHPNAPRALAGNNSTVQFASVTAR